MSRLILFDAVGTIIEPQPDVITAYHETGLKFGSQLSRTDVSARFKLARRESFHVGADAKATPAKSLPSSDEMEKGMWWQLVEQVFADVEETALLFDELWAHFVDPNNWSTFDDVAACWDGLKQMDCRIGIASNFDSRLHTIVNSHATLSQADFVFCSAEVGYRKPDPEFYRRLMEKLPNDVQTDNIVMVGDDVENDWAAPIQFGWQAFAIDRDVGSTESLESDHVISSLTELLDRIK